LRPCSPRAFISRAQRRLLIVSGGMKLMFFWRFETHGFLGGFSSNFAKRKFFFDRWIFFPS
jgi:hypothetical protein